MYGSSLTRMTTKATLAHHVARARSLMAYLSKHAHCSVIRQMTTHLQERGAETRTKPDREIIKEPPATAAESGLRKGTYVCSSMDGKRCL